MSDFSPNLTRNGAASTREAYPDGAEGIRASLEAMALKIREGRLDPDVIGWARDALRKRGIDGRGRTTVREMAEAILNEFRQQTVYTSDPLGAEVVQSAAATLCLRPNLCLRGGDCDDGTVAVVSALLAIGIPARIVKQTFGPQDQEHVLAQAQDERGRWIYLDPSTNLPIGQAHHASKEIYIDPLDAEEMKKIGIDSKPEIITIGRPQRLEPRMSTLTALIHVKPYTGVGADWAGDGGGSNFDHGGEDASTYHAAGPAGGRWAWSYSAQRYVWVGAGADMRTPPWWSYSGGYVPPPDPYANRPAPRAAFAAQQQHHFANGLGLINPDPEPKQDGGGVMTGLLTPQQMAGLANVTAIAAKTNPGTGWMTVLDASIQLGRRYQIAIVAPPGWTDVDAKMWFADFLIESMLSLASDPTLTMWRMTGVARKSQVLQPDSKVGIIGIMQEQAAQPAPSPAPAPGAPTAMSALTIGAIVVGVLGIAGGGYYLLEHKGPAPKKNPLRRRRSRR